MNLTGFQLRATKLEWKLALKRPRYYVSSETKPLRGASKRESTVAGREVPRGGIHQWRKAKQGDTTYW